MLRRDPVDHRPLKAPAERSRQSLSSGISKQYVFRSRRLASAKSRSITRTASRNRQIRNWRYQQPRSAPATLPDSPPAGNDLSHSSRNYLEDAHRECLPGARIIIARPRNVRYEEAVHAPLLQPAEFLSQTPHGRSILGVLQRIEDVFFSFHVPFLNVPFCVQAPVRRDELRCVLSYNPASDECEFFCNSHDVAIIGESSSRSYLVKRSSVQDIEPGMWTIAVPGNPVVWTPVSRGNSFSRYRPLVEFLLLKRTYSTTITRPAAAESHGNTKSPSTKAPLAGTVAEFIMGTVDPRASKSQHLATITEGRAVSPEGPFYQLQDGETAHVTTSPAASNNAGIERSYAVTAEAYKVTRLQKIDRNTNSSVFACIHSKLPHTTLVAKALNVRPKTRKSIVSLANHWRNEMEILRTLNHDNIVKILEWDARFYTVYLEHLPDSLASHPREPGFTKDEAERIMLNVASALTYLEEQRISHNDIKPRNIAYSPTLGAKVLDFGLATRGELVPAGAGGTSWYIPPEAIEGRRSIRGNVWALGVTMLYVLGIIDAPEEYGGQWDFFNVQNPNGNPRRDMESWVDFICTKVDELDRGDPMLCVIAWMLDQDPGERLAAWEIEPKLREKWAESMED